MPRAGRLFQNNFTSIAIANASLPINVENDMRGYVRIKYSNIPRLGMRVLYLEELQDVQERKSIFAKAIVEIKKDGWNNRKFMPNKQLFQTFVDTVWS